VTFVGRLASYRYYNMDQVVGQALAAYKRLSKRDSVLAAEALPTAMKVGTPALASPARAASSL
jgi:UDP-galactopyranose mutase